MGWKKDLLQRIEELEDEKQQERRLSERRQQEVKNDLQRVNQRNEKYQQELRQIKTTVATQREQIAKSSRLAYELMVRQSQKDEYAKELERSRREQERNMEKSMQQTREIRRQLGQSQQQLANVKNQLTNTNWQLKELSRQNQEGAQRLAEITANFNKSQEEIKSLKDPKKIRENSARLFQNFIDSLEKFDIFNKIPKDGDIKYVLSVGEVSGGKSSINNKMLGTSLQVGQQEVTDQIEKVYVHRQKNLAYFDSPGLNDQIQIINADILNAFYQMDYVFIITDRTFKNAKRCIQVFNKINPPQLVLVRNKCDLLGKQQYEKVKKDDQAYIQSLELGVYREVLHISTFEDDDFLDNRRFKRLWFGER